MKDLERRLNGMKEALTFEEKPSKTIDEFCSRWGEPEWRHLFGYLHAWEPYFHELHRIHKDQYYIQYCQDNPFNQERFDRAMKCFEDYAQIPEVCDANRRFLPRWVTATG